MADGAGNDLSLAVLFLLVCLAGGVLCTKLEKVTGCPYTVLLTLYGICLDSAFSGTVFTSASNLWQKMNPVILLGFFIIPLVFESAMKMHFFIVKKAKIQILLLATIVLTLSTFLTSLYLYIQVHTTSSKDLRATFNWPHALLMGTILSATDPVAVVALLEKAPVSHVLGTIIEGESLFNDGTAMVLYFIFYEFCLGRNLGAFKILYTFCRLVFVAFVVGWTFGHIASEFVGRFKDDTRSILMITFFACFATYFVAAIHPSGMVGPLCSEILAVVVCGLNIAAVGKNYVKPKIWEKVTTVWSFTSHCLNTILFVLLGTHIENELLQCYGSCANISDISIEIAFTPVLYIALHIIRLFSMTLFYPLLKKLGYGMSYNQILFISFAGLRGAIGLGLVLMVDRANEAFFSKHVKAVFLTQVAATIGLTLFVNANLVPRALKYLNLLEKSDDDFSSVADERSERLLMEAAKKALRKVRTEKYFEHVDWHAVMRRFPDEFQDLLIDQRSLNNSAMHTGDTNEVRGYDNNLTNGKSKKNSMNNDNIGIHDSESKAVAEQEKQDDKKSLQQEKNSNKSGEVTDFICKKVRKYYQGRILACIETMHERVSLHRQSYTLLLSVEEYVYNHVDKPFNTFQMLLNLLSNGTLRKKPSVMQRLSARILRPLLPPSDCIYECLVMFHDIHVTAIKSLESVKETGENVLRASLLERSIEAAVALETVIEECQSQIRHSSSIIEDIRKTYSIAVKAYETSFAYYTLRNEVLKDLNHYVETGELASRMERNFLKKLSKIGRFEFYSQQREFGHVIGFNCCYKQKNMTPYFAFDAINLDKYYNSTINYDDNQQNHAVVVEVEEKIANHIDTGIANNMRAPLLIRGTD